MLCHINIAYIDHKFVFTCLWSSIIVFICIYMYMGFYKGYYIPGIAVDRLEVYEIISYKL